MTSFLSIILENLIFTTSSTTTALRQFYFFWYNATDCVYYGAYLGRLSPFSLDMIQQWINVCVCNTTGFVCTIT